MNESREDGDVAHFEVISFNDGSDPTQQPVSPLATSDVS